MQNLYTKGTGSREKIEFKLGSLPDVIAGRTSTDCPFWTPTRLPVAMDDRKPDRSPGSETVIETSSKVRQPPKGGGEWQRSSGGTATVYDLITARSTTSTQ